MKSSISTQLRILGAAVMMVGHVFGQVTTTAPVAVSPGTYIAPTALPPDARDYLRAIGTHVQTPGKGRMTLTGTTADQHGAGTAQFVWQAPGNVRLDRQTAPAVPLVFTPTSGVQSAASLAQADLDLTENLAADSQEGFLYTFTQNAGRRLLGRRFRTDDGKTPNYQGPYYDIYEVHGAVPAANNAVRQKWYVFDNTTKLLVKTRYLIKRNGSDLAVECQYSNWVTQGGEAYPGQIVRTENGAAVFTFKTAQGVFGTPPNDALFPAH